MNTKSINLYIDRVVVEGLGELHQHKLHHAVQQELQRLISNQGLHQSLNRATLIKSISAKPINAKLSSERRLGIELANSVYRGLRR